MAIKDDVTVTQFKMLRIGLQVDGVPSALGDIGLYNADGKQIGVYNKEKSLTQQEETVVLNWWASLTDDIAAATGWTEKI